MKKLNKLLSVFVITGAVSASLGALAACGHTHSFEEGWTADGASGHYHKATCDDYTEKDNGWEEHTEANAEGKCDKCGYQLTTPSQGSVAVTGITITASANEVEIGGTITVSATLAPAGATGTVVWSSLDESKATVTSAGVVTGKAAGEVQIKATVGTVTQTKTITVKAAQQAGPSADLPEGTEGLAVSGITLVHELSTTKTSANIDLSGIVVKYADVNGDALEGEEALEADKYTVAVYNSAAPTTPLTSYDEIKDDATFMVYVELKADGEIYGQVNVQVKNPIVTLAVKTGANVLFEQKQSPTDSMSSTWEFEGTRANGDKVDVTKSDVTIGGMETVTVGENKTATLTFGTATGSVQYTINQNSEQVTQQFALNFAALSAEDNDAIKEQGENTHKPLVLQDGRFAVCSTKNGAIDAVGSADAAFEGKYFTKRLKMNGSSTSAKCPRYIKVKVDGPAVLTVYAYNNGSDTRGVSVYGGMSVSTEGNITATFSDQVGTKQDIASKTNAKFTFNITTAGDYYITSEVNGVCFTYVQLDQQMSAASNSEILLDTTDINVEAIEVTKNEEGVQHYAFGAAFDEDAAKAAYTVKTIGVNRVTCDTTKVDVTANATFTVSEDFATSYGEKTVTVTYDTDKTTSYKVIMDTPVPGIYGATADFSKELDTVIAEGTKLTVKKSDVIVALLGENADATMDYVVKYNEQTIDGETGLQFDIAATPYTLNVEITITLTGVDPVVISKTVDFSVTKKAEDGEQQAITINFSTVESVTNNTATDFDTYEKGQGVFKVPAAVQGKDKSATYGTGEGAKTFSKAIQISSSNTLTIKVTGPCIIKIYAATSGSSDRTLTGTGTGITPSTNNTASLNGETSKALLYEFTVSVQGEFVFKPNTSSMNIFMIDIVPASAE